MERALRRAPIVALLGPRQCGKSTLAASVVSGRPHVFFDLEDPVGLARLEPAPKQALEAAGPLVVLDEVQRMPELFPILRVLADRSPEGRFLILGSAAPDLVRQASESLAGRVEFVELGGFDLSEVGADRLQPLWMRGGFPRSFLASDEADSFAWRAGFIRTFLERDLLQWAERLPPVTLRRFWTMLAHYHGQTWNASECSRSLGISTKEVSRFLDLLTGTFMVRQLQPWFENVGKRLVRSPKVYLRDTGLLHALLGLTDEDAVLGHPKAGASWEGFALEQVLRVLDGEPWFWATHQGAELDLVLMRRRERWGFEFKRADAPRKTRSMHVAAADLRLDHLWVVYPGSERYPLGEHATALPLAEIGSLAE